MVDRLVLVEVRVLGPWESTVGGRPIRPTGKLRTVLALLAMSAGRAVPVDRIVEALWEEAELPDNPRASVQTYIARLRSLLGAAAITGLSDSYLLDVDPQSIDALRFSGLLEEAAGTGDPALERERLAEALRLWRGRPFEGVKSALLHDIVAPQLVERYLTAIERRIALDPEAAGPETVAELHELTSSHPLRESLWLKLIQLLWRLGRPAEALERYEVLRRRLADELGVDPSHELQAVHANLLAGQASEPEALPPGRRPDPLVPRQLPMSTGYFTGRDANLAGLDALLPPPGQPPPATVAILAIAGAAGVGKPATEF